MSRVLSALSGECCPVCVLQIGFSAAELKAELKAESKNKVEAEADLLS